MILIPGFINPIDNLILTLESIHRDYNYTCMYFEQQQLEKGWISSEMGTCLENNSEVGVEIHMLFSSQGSRTLILN